MRMFPLLPLLAGLLLNTALSQTTLAAQIAKPAEWRFEDAGAGVRLHLRQRRPDAVRAFFIARGFSSDDADAIARECIFLIGITNTAESPGAGALDIDLSGWRVDAGQGAQPLRLKEKWLQHWKQAGAPETARTAFYWSMYHSRQHLEPGERMFGMVSMGLPAESRFDLALTWRRGESIGQGSLPDLQCAPDPSHPQTKE